MRFKILVLLVIVGFSRYVSANTNAEQIERYFLYMKNLQYDSARHLIDNIGEYELQNQMSQLVNVLYFAGRNSVGVEVKEDSSSIYIHLFTLLRKGYSGLYNEKVQQNSFDELNEALVLARNEGLSEVEKFCILGIMKGYNSNYMQINEDVNEYIEQLGALASDPADQFHYQLNLAIFNYRSIFMDSNIDGEFFVEFEEIMDNFPTDHLFWPLYYSISGIYHETINEFDRAVQLHKKTFDLCRDLPFLQYLKFRSLIRLSELYREKKLYDSAIYFIHSAKDFRDLSDSIKSDFSIEYYLSKNLEEAGRFQEAYVHLQKAMDLKNHMDYQQNAYEIASLNRKYKTQEKELALIKEQEKVRSQQNMLIASVVVIIFILTLYFLYQKNMKKKNQLILKEKEIEKQKVTNLLKEQELVAIDAMISGQEKERLRIASDLHDDLGSLMATIKLYFDALEADLGRSSSTVYQKTEKLLMEAFDKIRSMAHSRNSGMLTKEGLLKNVENIAQKNTVSGKLKITVNHYGLDDRLDNTLELNLFRIIQELIANIVKHAEATEAHIGLTHHEDSLNILIEDNGVGFDTNRLSDKNVEGMGIRSIDKKIEFLQGSMEIDSAPGKGTAIIINIPL